ncbi:hypothetical protein [Archangium sp.]|uniref:hypothetical protein n=1 Tax=Archangium sp. TaxID=1872627 RepID=UPI00389AE201
MTDSVGVAEVKRLLDMLNEEQRRHVLVYLRGLLPPHPVETQLMISADGMLYALGRATDFTVRMIRGVFAEAAFATDVLPTIASRWRELPISGDPPYDFLLTDAPNLGRPPQPQLLRVEDSAAPTRDALVRVQVKMQRSEGKQPLYANEVWKTRVSWPSTHFVVELQKSRAGEKDGESTRPYRFSEFDVLAVSLGPARGRWGAFIYTVERWLLPDPQDPRNILTFQPVSPTDNDCWTTDFNTVVDWLRSGKERRINGDLPQVVKRAKRGKK